jgi:hypothetical protein
MASISGIGNEGPTQPARVRPRAGAPGWIDAAGAETAAGNSAPAGRTAPPLALDSLLALQESAGQPDPREPEADRRARSHGRRMLGALSHLQRLVLGGQDPSPALQHLLDLADTALPEASDPTLVSALGAIQLRVKVELARRGM